MRRPPLARKKKRRLRGTGELLAEGAARWEEFLVALPLAG
jgi:hypothetical protein